MLNFDSHCGMFYRRLLQLRCRFLDGCSRERWIVSDRPAIAGAKLREGTTTILPRGREPSRESPGLQCGITPLAGDMRDDEDGQERCSTSAHSSPYWKDRRLTGLTGPEYDPTISFGLPL